MLRRIYSGTLPGFPPHLRVAQVHQELPFLSEEDSEVTPVKYVVDWNPERRKLLRKIHAVENGLAEIDENGDEREVAYSVEKEAELLESLYDYLEDEGVATARAVRVLKELGFSEAKRTSPLKELSGGWKMRTAIACALSQEPDILLLDEPTNHLDLEGVEWLKSYINSSAAETLTVLVISHDSSFLDDICTEIIRFHQRALNYYVGKQAHILSSYFLS